jgi:hypothetical protein
LKRLPAFSRPDRRPLSDDAVVAFIRRNTSAASSHTALLRSLRNSGLACEQSRFREIFLATVCHKKTTRGPAT